MTDIRSASESDRRLKTILEEIHPEFVESGAKTITQDDVERLLACSDDLLKHFAKGGVLRRFAREVSPMLSLVRDQHSGEYSQAPYWTVAVITFVLLYVLKPVDIIPDALPVIGQLDDAVVVGHGLTLVRKELDRYRSWQRAVTA